MQRSPVVRFVSNLLFQSLSAVLASVVGGYLLMTLHLWRGPEQPPIVQAALPAASVEGRPARDERTLTRELLKARRESKEAPAEVRPQPAPSAAPTQAEAIAPKDQVTVDARASRPAGAALSVRKDLPPSGPETNAPEAGAPVMLAPVAVGALGPTDAQPPQAVSPARARGSVFSTLSMLMGTAANVTGDTINWVIDLPGKAVAAGGKLLDPSAPPPSTRPFSNTQS